MRRWLRLSLFSGYLHVHSFQGSKPFQETIKHPGETDPVFKRTMVEKNGESTPRIVSFFFGGGVFRGYQRDTNEDTNAKRGGPTIFGFKGDIKETPHQFCS